MMSNKLPKKQNASPPANQMVQAQYSSLQVGPIPDPDTLYKYEQVMPGLAERIMQMAEHEQQRRHQNDQLLFDLERKNARSLNWNIIRGQLLAFLSVTLVCMLCAYFAWLGNVEEAGSTARWIIIGLAGVFITGRMIIKRSQSPSDKSNQ